MGGRGNPSRHLCPLTQASLGLILSGHGDPLRVPGLGLSREEIRVGWGAERGPGQGKSKQRLPREPQMGLTEPHPVPIPAPPAQPNLSPTQTPVGFCEAGPLSNPGSSSRRATRAPLLPLCVSPRNPGDPGRLHLPKAKAHCCLGEGQKAVGPALAWSLTTQLPHLQLQG